VKRISLITAALVLLLASYSFAAGSDSPVTGTYINKADKEYMTLNPDGTCYLKLRKVPADSANPFFTATGTYKITGNDVLLELEGGGEAGGEASGSIKGNTFVDNEGKIWMKEGASEPSSMEPLPKKGLRK
jgi:hypothetical protein